MTNETNDWMNFHTGVVSVLICVGIWTNCMFLMSLKANKPKINNNERFHVFKTILILMALILYIPMNLWVIQPGHASFNSCILTGTFQKLFLDTYPVGIAAVAIIRFRLIICKGNADILVKKIFFLAIVLGCLCWTAGTAMSFLFLSLESPETTSTSKTNKNETASCHYIFDDVINKFNIGVKMMTYLVSSIVVILLYLQIVKLSTRSMRTVQQFTRNNRRRIGTYLGQRSATIVPLERQQNLNSTETRTRGTKICRSIILLLVVFFTVTIPISVLEIVLSLKESQFTLNITLLYFKCLMCVFHAVGEGTFTSEKRARTKLFLSKAAVSTSNTVVSNFRPTTLTKTCRSESFPSGQHRRRTSTQFLHFSPALNEIKETSNIQESSSCISNNIEIFQMSEVKMKDISKIVLAHEICERDLNKKPKTNEGRRKKSMKHLELISLRSFSRETVISTGGPSRCSILTRQISETSDSKLSSSIRPSLDFLFDSHSSDLDVNGSRSLPRQRLRSIRRTSACSILTSTQEGRMRQVVETSEPNLTSKFHPSLDLFCDSPLSDSVFSPTESVFDFEPFCSVANKTLRGKFENCNQVKQEIDQISNETRIETQKIKDSVRTLSVLSDNM